VRENGGQYTHGAIWTAMAFAETGRNRKGLGTVRSAQPHPHATDPGVARYKVEPYVVAADVYSVEPHAGRGGWSWYTGSAGWMYRLIVETLFGLSLEVDQLRLTPKLPLAWESFSNRFRDTFSTTATATPSTTSPRSRVARDGIDSTELRTMESERQALDELALADLAAESGFVLDGG
jgi:cyclic beta-1,2-glucan synthetase